MDFIALGDLFYRHRGRFIALSANNISQGLVQCLQVFFRGGPTGDEAAQDVAVGEGRPHFKGDGLHEFILFLWGEDDKLLVGGGIHSHLYAMTDENASKSFRHFVGMTGNAKIEVVREKRVKLDAQHTAFGQEGTMALDGGEEGSWCLDVAEDNRFAEHGPNLGATDIEGVHMLCQPGQGYVGLG